MEKKLIIFLDGSEIEAEINGNCFIVDEQPDFPEDLSTVVIRDDNDVVEIENVNVQECASTDGRYWFAFVPMSEIEMRFAEIEDALCELSMMEG